MKEAKYYKKLDDSLVQCQLCPQMCEIANGKRGMCLGRKNENGILYAENYGQTVSLSMDPIEKKPLYHFYPGKQILSVGPNGCNLTCDFCQNYTISQERAGTSTITPENLVTLCQKYDSIGVAFTYTEPLIWFEFILDAAKTLNENDLQVVLVTNGFINPRPLKKLLPFIHAMNIDLKSMKNEFYKKYCSGLLEPVKQTITTAAAATHIEITNLIITDCNDSREEIMELVEFVAQIDDKIPVHFSRYFPVYKMKKAPTKPATLKMAYDIAKSKLENVYVGNIQMSNTHHTLCPNCNEILIKRTGYHTVTEGIDENNACRKCGHRIRGVHLFE